MPYGVTPVTERSYYDAYQKGSQDRQQEASNALSLKRGEQAYSQNALAQQYQTEDRETDNKRRFATEMVQAAQYGLQAPNAKDFIRQNYPQLAKLNPTFETDSEEAIKASLQQAIGVFGPQAGIGPVTPKAPEAFTLSEGQTRFGGDGKPIANVAPKPTKAPARFRPMDQQEIAASGLPPGTAAQVNDDTGAIQVLSKRDASSTLSQKDATTAKMKLTTVVLARKQLNAIKEAFEEGRGGLNAFGPGQGMLPTQAGKKFDGRVDQMRSTLTALTRVPGVGAMSDYETKLDQSKFPSRSDYETVTADKLTQLDDMLTLIETGYKDLLSGGQTQGAPDAPQSPAQPPAQGPVRVTTPQEAMALPSGTQFVTPDGRIKVRP